MTARAGIDSDLAAIIDVRTKVAAARDAAATLADADQETLDRYVRAMASAGRDASAALAEHAVSETGCGVYEDKIVKNRFNTDTVAEWMLSVRAIGVLWSEEASNVTAIGSPMGVIAALIPVTNPTSTTLFKSLAAVKAGNAIVHSPHPRAAGCTMATSAVMAEAAIKAGAPEGLISCLEQPSIESTRDLMAHRDIALVLATGGADMVRAAYSSGKPTIAVGPGNVPAYIHSSVGDLAEATEMVVASKSFDNGTACVAEQSVIIDRSLVDRFEVELDRAKVALLDGDAAPALAETLFDDQGRLRPDLVGLSAPQLATRAGIEVPAGTRALALWRDVIGPEDPLSAEILAPVLTLYHSDGADDGLELCQQVLTHGGEGHTAVIHATDSRIVARFSSLRAGRLLVNTPALIGGMGYSTGIEPSFQLGTGTWSGSISSDNITPLHLVNIKRLAGQSREWRSVYELGAS